MLLQVIKYVHTIMQSRMMLAILSIRLILSFFSVSFVICGGGLLFFVERGAWLSHLGAFVKVKVNNASSVGTKLLRRWKISLHLVQTVKYSSRASTSLLLAGKWQVCIVLQCGHCTLKSSTVSVSLIPPGDGMLYRL